MPRPAQLKITPEWTVTEKAKEFFTRKAQRLEKGIQSYMAKEGFAVRVQVVKSAPGFVYHIESDTLIGGAHHGK